MRLVALNLYIVALWLAQLTPALGQSGDWAPESIPVPAPEDIDTSAPSEEAPVGDEAMSNEDVGSGEQDLIPGKERELRIDDDARESELGLTQAEIRGQKNHGLALIVGPSNPWMSMGIEGYQVLTDTASLSLSFGRGQFSINGRKGQIEYDVDTTSTSTLLAWRYHLNDMVPMFVSPMLGYATWKGRLNPSGTDDPNSISEVELLKTGFSAAGLVAGASVGLTANWENGFFLEYVLINYSQAFPISEEYTSEAESAQDQVNKSLRRPGSWGLLNLKIGYFF
jgi:hypothetical protein